MLEGMGREEMRAADADRQQVADQLRAALDEGRLDLVEYDERLRDTYAAKTYADLDRQLADLPTSVPVIPAATPAPGRGQPDGMTSEWLRHLWSPWGKAVGFFTVIWLINSMIDGGLAFYWPLWVLGPWAVLLLLRTAAGLTGGEPRKHAEVEEFRRRLREHKRERKALQARAIVNGELPVNATKEQRRAFVAEAVARGDLPPKPRRPEAGKPAIQDG
jgi:hypothetical protein